MITPTNPTTDRGLTSSTATTAPGEAGRPFARVSWGSIFAGAALALATQLVLTLIGAAIGLATLDPGTGDNPSATSFGIGAGIWLVVTSLISLFVGGYIAARLGGTFNGWIHGLATWATVTIATILLLTTAAGTLIGTASGLTNFATANSSRAAQIQLPPAIQRQVDQLQAQARQSADQAATQAERAQAAADQPGEQPVERQAKEVANRAVKGSAAGTGAAALGLILGALAAAFGGKTGQRDFWRYSVEEHTGGGSSVRT